MMQDNGTMIGPIVSKSLDFIGDYKTRQITVFNRTRLIGLLEKPLASFFIAQIDFISI
jgi:hypothetical protein